MQLLAKFQKIMYMRFRATLNFQKFKVALNRILNFCFYKICTENITRNTSFVFTTKKLNFQQLVLLVLIVMV